MAKPYTEFTWPILGAAAAFFLNGALLGVWASRIPGFAFKLDLSVEVLGLVLLSLAGGAILFFPVAGRMSDRFGAAPVTRVLGFGCVIAALGLPFARSAIELAALLFIFGAVMGALDISMNAWAGEIEKALGRPLMNGIHALFSLGAGVGASAGAMAVHADLSIMDHFWALAIGLGVLTLPLTFVRWQSATQKTGERVPVFALPKGALIMVGLLAFAAALGEGAMVDWSGIYLVLAAGVSEATAAWGFAVFSAGMVVMRLAGNFLCERFGVGVVARSAGGVAGLGILTVIFGGQLWLIMIGFALLGLGLSVIFPLAFSRAAHDPHLPPGTALAAVGTLGYGGILLGPVIIGVLGEYTGDLRIAFGLIAVLCLFIVVFGRALETDVTARD